MRPNSDRLARSDSGAYDAGWDDFHLHFFGLITLSVACAPLPCDPNILSVSYILLRSRVVYSFIRAHTGPKTHKEIRLHFSGSFQIPKVKSIESYRRAPPTPSPDHRNVMEIARR